MGTRISGLTGRFSGIVDDRLRAAALLVGLSYLIVVVASWLLIAGAGHDGIVWTHGEEWRDDGVVINDVTPDTPAASAGIRPGDILIRVDGVSTRSELIHDQFHRQRAGDLTTVQVRRVTSNPAAPIEDLRFQLLSRLQIPQVVFDLMMRSLVGLAVVAIAVAVAALRPREPATRPLLIFATCFSLLPVSDITHWAMPSASLANLQDDFGMVATTVGAAGLLHLFLSFPEPRRPFRWLRRLGQPALRAVGGGTLVLYAIPLVVIGLVVAVTGEGAWFGASLMTLLLLATSLAALVRGYFTETRALARQQLKWIMVALAVGVAALAFAIVAPAATGGRAQALVPVVSIAAWLCFPTAIGFAILRYRLWDIDLLVNRTLVYGALTASVVGIYVLVVGGLGMLLNRTGSLTLSLVATGLVAVLVQPLRERLQRAIDRLVYGERAEPYQVLSQLGRRLETALAPEDVLPTIVLTVREALGLRYAAIALAHGGQPIVVAAVGEPGDDFLRLPLVYQHEAVGELRVSPPSHGHTFEVPDRRLLDDIARAAGAAAHAVRLTYDLRRSRERLVAAREEERRRLRRDLHDGLGPALAAISLKLGSARAILPVNVTGADTMLAAVEDDVEQILKDLRRLVYDLRPPVLDQLGLLGALREAAASYGFLECDDGESSDWNGPALAKLIVHVEAPEVMPPLPAAVEVAAFRVVHEALANVVRHARARRCRVLLTVFDGLRIAIVDDGVGLANAHAGVGLASMRERAEELGGWCRVDRLVRGGTRVLAYLPLSHAADGDVAVKRSDVVPDRLTAEFGAPLVRGGVR